MKTDIVPTYALPPPCRPAAATTMAFSQVLEAEMMQANSTDHGFDGKPSLSQEGLEGAEARVASQVVADTAV